MTIVATLSYSVPVLKTAQIFEDDARYTIYIADQVEAELNKKGEEQHED